MAFFLIPVVIVAAVKAYFLHHGLSIGSAAMQAGFKAYRNGDDIVDAAIDAGASRAAACLLRDAFYRFA